MILCDKTQVLKLKYSVYLRPLHPMQATRESDLTECLVEWISMTVSKYQGCFLSL